MDTVDKVEVVAEKKTRGRPKKQDAATPMGEYIAKQAKVNRAKRENAVVEKYYELAGTKLSFIKKVASGSVFKTFVGSTTDKKTGAGLKEEIKRLQADGKLRIKV
jgi:hypothetical protein